MILLNGAEAEDREVDPKRHRFIGIFRFPYSVLLAKRSVVWALNTKKYNELYAKFQNGILSELDFRSERARIPNAIPCPCGDPLLSPYKDVIFEHYQLGHFDLPQYVNIE